MVSINGSVPMSFAASEEPAAYGELVSIGGIGPGVNGKLSAAVAEVLETKLSVSRSRFYIKFDDVQVLLPTTLPCASGFSSPDLCCCVKIQHPVLSELSFLQF